MVHDIKSVSNPVYVIKVYTIKSMSPVYASIRKILSKLYRMQWKIKTYAAKTVNTDVETQKQSIMPMWELNLAFYQSI